MRAIVLFLGCFFLFNTNLMFGGTTPETAPEFSAEATTDSVVSLSQFRGQVVLVDFWASWCKPCQAEFPFLVNLAEQNSDKKFVVLAVNVDEYTSNMNKFLEDRTWGKTFTVLKDPEGKIPALYKVDRMPTTILIDQNGEIRARHGGFSNSEKETLTEEVNALFTEKSS